MAYKSSYTGPQIDQAVGNALNKDTSTLSNDVNHIPASSVVKSALNTVDESIAFRVSGNKTTYASGVAIGQYVIVDGSTITGITDGLYKAAKAIPYNTVIDSTYLTAASGGGLNELKAALTNVENSIPILFDNNFYESQLSFSDANKAVAMEGCYQSLIKTGKKITTFLRFNGGYYVPVIYIGSASTFGNAYCLEINIISVDLNLWARNNSTSTWSIVKTFT